jgi:hypothetical protein
MGMEYEPVPVPGQKKVGGGRTALKLLMAVLLAGFALRLLADHCASYRLPPPAAPEEALALAVTEPEQDADGVDGSPATPNGERAAGSWKMSLCSLALLSSFFLLCSLYYCRHIDGNKTARAFSGELALVVGSSRS